MGKYYKMSSVALLISILCLSDAYSIYGNQPTAYSNSPHSFATFATTNSFHYTNKNFLSGFVKYPQLALGTHKSFPAGVVNSIEVAPVPDLSAVVAEPINEKKSINDNTLKEVKTVTEELVRSVVPETPSPSVPATNESNNNDPFNRPPTIQRVSYSIPVNQPTISGSIGKYIYQTQQGLQSLAVVVPSKVVDTKVVPAPPAVSTEVEIASSNTPASENQQPNNDRIDKDDEFQFHREVTPVLAPEPQPGPDTTQNTEQASSQPPPTTNDNVNAPPTELPTFFFPAQRPQVSPNQPSLEPFPQPIENRQDSNVEQPESFFFAPQRQQPSGPPNHPSLELPVPGSNRFALPPSSQSNLPTPPAPTYFPGGNFNRFAVPPSSQQPGNQNQQQPGPPPPGFPFQRNLFPGGGPPPPGQEPENGYNPFHQYEQFPEPPYESEFANEPPLNDAPTPSQRSAGPNAPPPVPDFAQSTLRNVRTEELIEVTQRKQIKPDCAYNTISYGPDGEDCIQIRKRRFLVL
ncbi:hypothetical protein Ocin01_01315 [Orchesella cincta]|uniref:Uncharacterized protein n=1 Tax=Orchesella cincta TaxID=48709 RepID=A0A1D2NJC0_ORCCI|nr:hypothetical protein Ocin01_01315 [Orchesella cincta]